MEEQIIHATACGGAHATTGGCFLRELWPMESPQWSRLLTATAAHGKDLHWSGFLPEDCTLEQVKREQEGAAAEELLWADHSPIPHPLCHTGGRMLRSQA